MTDLTADEKAQVAELLGWLPESDGGSPITLEALLAYCRERDIPHGLRWNRYSKKYEVLTGTGPTLVERDHPDPLTAFVRAVLAAHEQEKAG